MGFTNPIVNVARPELGNVALVDRYDAPSFIIEAGTTFTTPVISLVNFSFITVWMASLPGGLHMTFQVSWYADPKGIILIDTTEYTKNYQNGGGATTETLAVLSRYITVSAFDTTGRASCAFSVTGSLTAKSPKGLIAGGVEQLAANTAWGTAYVFRRYPGRAIVSVYAPVPNMSLQIVDTLAGPPPWPAQATGNPYILLAVLPAATTAVYEVILPRNDWILTLSAGGTAGTIYYNIAGVE